MSFGQITVIKRDGTDSGVMFPLTSAGATIGRDIKCSIRVHTKKVSRLHCKIAIENNCVSKTRQIFFKYSFIQY